ncbi:acetyltransferase [Niastella vici]|uniref:Acetyltransferase n=1 Tax=Niastella vici TaxID=1703345 RepID=A0A1V9FMM5_9BACT|nr:GNAT family N-acetyltransferase [Niastella vici]OQP59506.1 acetyltransferase [Niastella vici]
MITYTTSKNDKDLQQILQLQKQNLAAGLTAEQIASQGFVTVMHSFEDLKKMNDIEAHVIAKDDDRVIAYLLAMTNQSRFDIPVLVAMFEMFEKISYQHKKIADYRYIVVGQVCVAEGYRGKGVFDTCYAAYSHNFKNKYEFAITEIATRNQRSIRAHKRVGFETIHEYTAPDGEEWSIVLWKW